MDSLPDPERTRVTAAVIPLIYMLLTDLDFAVDIASSCLSSSAANMQSMVLSIEHKVGLKIDQWSQDRIYALWLQYSLAGFVVFL